MRTCRFLREKECEHQECLCDKCPIRNAYVNGYLTGMVFGRVETNEAMWMLVDETADDTTVRCPNCGYQEKNGWVVTRQNSECPSCHTKMVGTIYDEGAC